jgi:hypothetical protein
LVRAALRLNGYAGLRHGEAPELIVVFHWGCLRPDSRGSGVGPFGVVLNQGDMLELVGGRALVSNSDRILQSALIDAAADERYFLIVSAYEPPNSGEELSRLLWRTQCSLPSDGLSQEQALPILAAAGAVHFGRETVVPDFVTLDVERMLRDAVRSATP